MSPQRAREFEGYVAKAVLLIADFQGRASGLRQGAVEPHPRQETSLKLAEVYEGTAGTLGEVLFQHFKGVVKALNPSLEEPEIEKEALEHAQAHGLISLLPEIGKIENSR